jgi:hypothetical protein
MADIIKAMDSPAVKKLKCINPDGKPFYLLGLEKGTTGIADMPQDQFDLARSTAAKVLEEQGPDSYMKRMHEEGHVFIAVYLEGLEDEQEP